MAAFQNNGKLKLLIIVGTRPEIIRLAEVIRKCRRYFDTLLAHTGQNYDYTLNGVFFRDLELDAPDVYLDAVGDTLGQTMGNIIAKSYDLMAQQMPDAVLVLGDTNRCLSVIGPSGCTFPFFIWKPATAARTNASRKKPTAALWTSFRTSTCATPSMRGATWRTAAFPRSAPT